MLFARYWLAVPALAIAGLPLGAQGRSSPPAPAPLPTDTPLFVGLAGRRRHPWWGALDVWSRRLPLGPIVEHLNLIAAK